MNAFPDTSWTLIEKIKTLGPERDSAEWVRFWDRYHGAIRTFAAFKGGEENADDIVMIVLGKLVEVLRSGKCVAEKGRFHSYLTAMIVNEARMAHRRDLVRKTGAHVSIDSSVGDGDGVTFKELLAAPAVDDAAAMDEDWRKAVLESARNHVLMHTAVSDRDRQVYRDYAIEGMDIGTVAAKYSISRNYVSQIKTRLDKRIIDFGRELIDCEGW